MTKHIQMLALSFILALMLAACTSTAAVLTRGAALAVRVVSKVSTTETASLCDYYAQHRVEVDAVREYARANWTKVPEEYKPSLLAINEELNACDASSQTQPRRLYAALKKAVALYGELRSAGVI